MTDPEIMHRARQARDQLIARFIYHPAVTLIGIGGAPAKEDASETGGLVLEIHVRPDWAGRDPDEPLPFPDEVDGFPVRVVPGEYELESEAHPDRASPERSSRSVIRLEGGSAMTIPTGSNTDQGDDHPLSMLEFEQIGGIGHKTAQAFNSMGFRSFAELLAYLERTPTEAICEEMQAHGVGYKPGLFPKDKLVEKLRKLVGEREAERPEEPLPAAQVEEEAPDLTVRFTVSFSWEPQPDGSRRLCTRVYDERNCGEEVPFYGEDPHPWVAWMMEHANIQTNPEVMSEAGAPGGYAEPEQAEQEVPEAGIPFAYAEPVQEEGAPIELDTPTGEAETIQDEDPFVECELLSMEVYQPAPLVGKESNTLIADIKFRLSAARVDYLITSGNACQVGIYLHNTENDTKRLLSTSKQELFPGKTDYQQRVEFTIPTLGHYDIETHICMATGESTSQIFLYCGAHFTVVPLIPQDASKVF